MGELGSSARGLNRCGYTASQTGHRDAGQSSWPGGSMATSGTTGEKRAVSADGQRQTVEAKAGRSQLTRRKRLPASRAVGQRRGCPGKSRAPRCWPSAGREGGRPGCRARRRRGFPLGLESRTSLEGASGHALFLSQSSPAQASVPPARRGSQRRWAGGGRRPQM